MLKFEQKNGLKTWNSHSICVLQLYACTNNLGYTFYILRFVAHNGFAIIRYF